MLQRDMGLTPFIAMMDTLGLDSSIRDSFVQGSTEFCLTMQTFEQGFSVLAVCYNQLGVFKKISGLCSPFYRFNWSVV